MPRRMLAWALRGAAGWRCEARRQASVRRPSVRGPCLLSHGRDQLPDTARSDDAAPTVEPNLRSMHARSGHVRYQVPDVSARGTATRRRGARRASARRPPRARRAGRQPRERQPPGVERLQHGRRAGRRVGHLEQPVVRAGDGADEPRQLPRACAGRRRGRRPSRRARGARRAWRPPRPCRPRSRTSAPSRGRRRPARRRAPAAAIPAIAPRRCPGPYGKWKRRIVASPTASSLARLLSA